MELDVMLGERGWSWRAKLQHSTHGSDAVNKIDKVAGVFTRIKFRAYPMSTELYSLFISWCRMPVWGQGKEGAFRAFIERRADKE